MQATKPAKPKPKLYTVFLFTFKLIEKYLGVVDIGSADSFTVDCLDPLALSN